MTFYVCNGCSALHVVGAAPVAAAVCECGEEITPPENFPTAPDLHEDASYKPGHSSDLPF